MVVGGGALTKSRRKVWNSVPDEAVESLEAIVLLMMFTFNASWMAMPAPSHPATLLTMMLLVRSTEYQFSGLFGKRETSVPLMAWRRIPPPEPESAALP